MTVAATAEEPVLPAGAHRPALFFVFCFLFLFYIITFISQPNSWEVLFYPRRPSGQAMVTGVVPFPAWLQRVDWWGSKLPAAKGRDMEFARGCHRLFLSAVSFSPERG